MVSATHVQELTEVIHASLRNLANLASVSGLENIFTFGVPWKTTAITENAFTCIHVYSGGKIEVPQNCDNSWDNFKQYNSAKVSQASTSLGAIKHSHTYV